MPREAVGVVADLPIDIAPATPTDPQTPARLVVEQVSAVEHASVAGVSSQLADGTPAMSSGLGRPLILTTLEVPEALRLLGTGRRVTALVTAVLIVTGVMLIGVGVLLAIAAPALAASPIQNRCPTPSIRAAEAAPVRAPSEDRWWPCWPSSAWKLS